MRVPVPTPLPDVAPIGWAVRGGPLLATAHVPLRADGSVDTGDVASQAELTFANLRAALDAASASLDDVVQVVIHLVDVDDGPVVNEVWRRVFREPWPNRAIIGCAALTVPGMKIELTALAWIGGDR